MIFVIIEKHGVGKLLPPPPPPPSGIRPHADQKGPPLYYFRYPFWVKDPIKFLISKNTLILRVNTSKNVKFFQKEPKTPFWLVFFQFACGKMGI